MDASKKPTTVPNIKDIRTLHTKGPWMTKSNAELSVIFAFPLSQTQKLLDYDREELAYLPSEFNIKGLRCYSVRGLKNKSVGGTEFHRIRQEILFGLEGAIDFEFEDIFGSKRNVTIDKKTGVYLPPFILHTYESRQDNSGLLVFCNTLFNPEDKRTHDTYSKEVFKALQQKYH